MPPWFLMAWAVGDEASCIVCVKPGSFILSPSPWTHPLSVLLNYLHALCAAMPVVGRWRGREIEGETEVLYKCAVQVCHLLGAFPDGIAKTNDTQLGWRDFIAHLTFPLNLLYYFVSAGYNYVFLESPRCLSCMVRQLYACLPVWHAHTLYTRMCTHTFMQPPPPPFPQHTHCSMS